MTVQIFTDGVLAYDSRLQTTQHKYWTLGDITLGQDDPNATPVDYTLLELTVTNGLNKAGTAVIKMPPGHPAYYAYSLYKTVVTIYRAGKLRFRGRVLFIQDDFLGRRTITCEGEMAFLMDSVARPYQYQDGPAAIFKDLIALHNAQVDAEKQFMVGSVTVTDPNNYIRLESETAEQTSDVINKLLDRVGGYIDFTTNAEGQRVISWYEELGYRSSQVIEFGNNLLDFARNNGNEDMATVIIPYGAKNEETGERLTVKSVNNDLDFIQDYDAVYLRGIIAKPVYWDDVTEPENLLKKAQKYLAEHRSIITALDLSAVDLSVLDANIDTMEVGDTIRVRSTPHGVDEDFLLEERTEDLLNPANDKVTLGKDRRTLTGQDAMGDYRLRYNVQVVEQNIKADYTLNIRQAVEETKATLSSLIQQTSEAIMMEVSETYMTGDEVTAELSTRFEQLSDSFTFTFNALEEIVNGNDENTRTQFKTIEKYIRFVDGNIILGEEGNQLTLHIENDRISFLDEGAEVAYFSNKQLYVTDGHFLNSLRIGDFALIPRENKNLSLVKLGE